MHILANKKTFHIIGAGIAGLYVAKRIKEKYPSAKVVIYEAAQKAGGRCGSSFSSKLGCQTDNATHVILSVNKLARVLIGENEFIHKIRFWNMDSQHYQSVIKSLPEAQLAAFNTSNADWRIRLKLFEKVLLLPTLKAFYSQGKLYDTLCAPLLKYADDILFGYIWQGFEKENNLITKLIFNQQKIAITSNDTIISAVDSAAYEKVFAKKIFSYKAIANVFFRTSMPLTFPLSQKMLGICHGKSQWIFSGDNYTAVTISDARQKPDAREIRYEICRIRNYNSAFLPETDIRFYPTSTINQDAYNNRLRPRSAETALKNLFLCGDWTMKNHPCCIESALLSVERLIKCI